MMRWLIDSSMKFRLVVVVATAALLVVGVSQLRSAPVDVLPEFGPPTVEIQTEALGLSASEVEQLITVPLEQDLLVGVPFVEDIRSESVPSLSRILLVFEPSTDIFRARQVVAERLTQAHALPHVSKPPQMLQPLSATNRADDGRRLVEQRLRDPDVAARSLDDRPAPDGDPGGRERGDLGPAGSAAPGAGRSGAPA